MQLRGLASRSWHVLALCGCVVVLGCSSPAEEASPGGAPSNGSGGTSMFSGGGQATGGTSTSPVGGSSGAAAQAGAPAAPPMACETYVDSGTWSLLVQIKNERTEPVYLGQDTASCDVQRVFQVEDGARAVLPSLDGCHSSCQTLMQTGPVACPLACAAPSTITLQPGETLKVPWDGRFGVPQNLPQQCLPSAQQGASTSCIQAKRIEPSVFTFSARAGTKHQCLAAGGACTCTPNQNGGCTTPSSLISGTIITTRYLVKLEPGEISPGGESQYIGLVFQNE